MHYVIIDYRKNLNSQLNKISELNVTKLELHLKQQVHSEEVAPMFLGLSAFRSNLEELEVISLNVDYIYNFVKNWTEYHWFAKLTKVTFTCNNFIETNYLELKEMMKKYFNEWRHKLKSIICTDIIQVAIPNLQKNIIS